MNCESLQGRLIAVFGIMLTLLQLSSNMCEAQTARFTMHSEPFGTFAGTDPTDYDYTFTVENSFVGNGPWTHVTAGVPAVPRGINFDLNTRGANPGVPNIKLRIAAPAGTALQPGNYSSIAGLGYDLFLGVGGKSSGQTLASRFTIEDISFVPDSSVLGGFRFSKLKFSFEHDIRQPSGMAKDVGSFSFVAVPEPSAGLVALALLFACFLVRNTLLLSVRNN